MVFFRCVHRVHIRPIAPTLGPKKLFFFYFLGAASAPLNVYTVYTSKKECVTPDVYTSLLPVAEESDDGLAEDGVAAVDAAVKTNQFETRRARHADQLAGCVDH